MPKKHPTHPERQIGHWMRVVAAHVTRALGDAFDAHGVTAAEWVVLRDLFDQDAETSTPGELAKRLGSSRGQMSKLVARLTTKELVEIYEDEMDARFQVVVLSAAGHALVPKLAGLADRIDADFFGHLKPNDRTRLLETLKRVAERKGLNEPPAG